jgi:FkbH-like protein
MSISINLSSTSSLLPENSLWEKKNYVINFEDYGNLFSISKNSKKKFDCEVKVIFFADLIDYSSLDLKKIKFYKEKLSKIIDMIDFQSSKNNQNIIYYSFYDQNEFHDKLHGVLISELSFFFQKNINRLTEKNNNLKIISLDNLFSNLGFEKNFDLRNYYLMKSRFSLAGIKKLSKSIFFHLSTEKKRKKVLLLDCDNTLWGGVVGEDGYNKIILGDEGIGLIYKNFQKVVKKLINSGVLIVLVSKNNEFDVKEVLKKNKNMILKEKDITAMKVNWQEKSKNIIELSKELSLGMDSFVFWDDNPIERKKVKMKVKGVTVIDPKNNIEEWPRQLASLNIFESEQLTKEDKIKTQLYKIRDDFVNNKKNYDDEVQYLKSINISVKVHEINKNNIVRAEQLCNKTNQFNLNLKRLNQKEIIKLTKNKNYDLKMLSLKDDYGDHGLIAIYGINFQKDKFKIDLFAMSCRVLGRYLENWILNKIKDYAKIKKKNFIHADFVKGPRNNIFKQFLLNNGFSNIRKKNETGVYKMNILNKIKYLEIYEKNR